MHARDRSEREGETERVEAFIESTRAREIEAASASTSGVRAETIFNFDRSSLEPQSCDKNAAQNSETLYKFSRDIKRAEEARLYLKRVLVSGSKVALTAKTSLDNQLACIRSHLPS